jgi:hypothetical protein
MPNWTHLAVTSLAVLMWLVLVAVGVALLLPPAVPWVTSREVRPQHATPIGAGVAALVAAALAAFALRWQAKGQSNAFGREVFKARLAVLGELCRRCSGLRERVERVAVTHANAPDLRERLGRCFGEQFDETTRWAVGHFMILPDDVFKRYNAFLWAADVYVRAAERGAGSNSAEAEGAVSSASARCTTSLIDRELVCRRTLGLESLAAGDRKRSEGNA